MSLLTWRYSSNPNDVELVMKGYGELSLTLATCEVDAIWQSEPQVEATELFRANLALAETYVRETVFEGALTAAEYRGAMNNTEFSTDLTAAYIQSTTDMMTRYGLGKMAKAPVASDWVKLDLLVNAKRDVRAQ